MERDSLRWRHFFRTVNARDFSRMVMAELALIGLSTRVAIQSFRRPPIGPVTAVVIVALAVIRLMALAVAVIVLGAAVLVTVLVRGAAKTVRARVQRS